MSKLVTFPMVIALAAAVSACGNTAARYQPIVDGPRDSRYLTDLKDCQEVATQRSYANGDVGTNALVGGGLGALLGAGSWEGALVGGLIGTTFGGGLTAWDARSERKDIVINCMRARNHAVVD